jgi:hypothetical protein
MFSFKQFLNEEFKKIGHQLGSNPGGVHVDTETGEKHYVKYYRNPEQAKSEALAARIHEHMGIHTLKPKYQKIDGKHAVVTKWNDHLEKMHPHHFENLTHSQQHDIGKMYHAAVLTKNWDIVGLGHDNIERDKHTGHLHSVDAGGTFNFRAQGGHKDYGPDVDEKHSLLHRPGEASSHVFSHVFKHNPEAKKAGLHAVKNMDMHHVEKLFKNSGLHNHEELLHNFKERRKKLLDDRD